VSGARQTTVAVREIVGLLLVCGLAGAVVWLHYDNAKLQSETTEWRRRNAPVARLAEDNERARELLAQTTNVAKTAVRDRQREVERLRAEVGELERRARAVAAQKAAEVAARLANRDPEQALAALENFRNVGRGSPATAVQTLVWAAMQADEATLLASIALGDDAREKAQQLLARLPEAARTKYPTPENLAALMVTREILRADAAQIVATTPVDVRRATVSVRLAGADGTETVATEFAADGWKVTVPKKLLVMLEKRLNPPAPVAGAKK